MVKRVFVFLRKEVSDLHAAAYLLAFFSILSQILAIVRDRLLTYSFGAGSELDIYYASFKVPDTIFVLIASIVSVSVLIPFLVDKMDQGREKEKEFINEIFSFFSIFMVASSILACIFMPQILGFFYKGMNPEKLSQVITLSRILLIQPFILGFANLFGSIVQAYKQFMIFAIGPVLYNLGIILGIIFLYPIFGIKGLVYGVILGAIFHLLIQLPTVFAKGLIPRFKRFNFKIIKEVIILSLPRTMSLGIGTVAILFLTAIASRMTDGSIAIFTLAFNLQGVPLAIIGMSYSLAAFPSLSRMFLKGDKAGFTAEIVASMKHMVFWSFPIIVLFVILRAQIVRVILGASTKFTWEDTKLTAALFAIMAISVLAQSVVLLITRAFYAAKITSKPSIVNISTALFTVFFSLFFLILFRDFSGFREFILNILRVDGVAGSEVLMLGLGYTIASIINASILWLMFRNRFQEDYSNISKTFVQSVISSILMAVATYFALDIFDDVFTLSTVFGVFMQGFVSGIIGITTGVLTLILIGNQEIREIWSNLHNKFWKRKPELISSDII